MQRKKIALVYDAIYPFIKGGGEKRFHELGKQLVREGYEVHLYGMKLWDGPKVIERDGLILHGIAKARPLYTKDGKRSISAPLLFGLSCFKLLGADFDRIDCCGFPYFSLFPARLAAWLKRKPLYATWHEVWGRNYWREYLGRLGFIGFTVEWLAARLPNRIIANSAQTAERLRTELHAKTPVSIIPNGIDTSYMFELAQAEQASDLLYVGRLVTYKNVHLILKALAVLKQNGTELRCTIIGDGPEKSRLQKLATKLGVDKQVRWLSFIEDSSDLYRHMHAADLFVLPSEREGFGMVALEANACGTPVLTLDHPENAARHLIVPGKNGQLFHRTADHLASVIQSSRATSKAAWQKECRAVAQKFEWRHLGRELAEVYES